MCLGTKRRSRPWEPVPRRPVVENELWGEVTRGHPELGQCWAVAPLSTWDIWEGGVKKGLWVTMGQAIGGNLQCHLHSSRKLRKRWCYWKLSWLCGTVWLTEQIGNVFSTLFTYCLKLYWLLGPVGAMVSTADSKTIIPAQNLELKSLCQH